MLGLCAIWSPRAAAQNRSLPQVTIRMDRVPMSQIMSEIERQTKYLFVTGSDVKTDRITSLDVTAVPLTEALNRMVAGADLTYDIRSLSIILSVKKAEQPAAVAGYVRDGSGQPVIGATIIVRDTSTGTTTDADGRFTLSVPAPSTAWLEVSYLGYEPQGGGGGVGRYGGGDGHGRGGELRRGQHRRLLRGDRRKAESEELAGGPAAGAHVRRAGCKNRRRRNDG